MHDLILRDGLIVDGNGGDPFVGDVVVDGGAITAVTPAGRGRDTTAAAGQAKEVIDATDRIVTPGFVDIHTHYDGQITWENRLAPSSHHGVTTVVMGNCGVGFAPCRAEDRELLIQFMEGVEDIPEVVMTKGVPWNWETFPDYLDALANRHADVDFGAQIPHSAIRIYAMGHRGAAKEAPTTDELARMAAVVEEAVRAGAIGVSSSRSIQHHAKDGRLAPSVHSEEDELLALADGLRRAGTGVLQLIPNPFGDPATEFGVIRRAAEVSGRPTSFTLAELYNDPDGWKTHLAGLAQARADGLTLRAQVLPRPVGAMFGLANTRHPFSFHPSYLAIAGEPIEAQVAAWRDPSFRDRILAESTGPVSGPMGALMARVESMYLVDEPMVYDPTSDQSVAALAAARGTSVAEVAYDHMLRRGADPAFYMPVLNYMKGNLSSVRQMMLDPGTVFGLGDGGAHYGVICDASYTTYTLLRWVRDASATDSIGLPFAIASLTSKPAATVGMTDRGVIAVGKRADLNVIDLDGLTLAAPRVVSDLPEGGRRMIQPTRGYDATIVRGEVTYRNGEATGALPGRLVRGAKGI